MAARLWQDIRYSLRQLGKTPVATAVAILSIALGIGANTAIFSVTNALILRMLPVQHPEQLVELHTVMPGHPDVAMNRTAVPVRAFDALRKQSTAFSDTFAWDDQRLRNMEANGVLYPGTVIEVSGDYFSTLGVKPLLGRLLTPRDTVPGAAAKVAVLDYRCWKDRFNADPHILGKIIRADNVPLTIVGVTPERFQNLTIDDAADAAVPLGFDHPDLTRRLASVIGRLKPGVTVGQARAQLLTMWPSILESAVPPGFKAVQRARFLSRFSKLSVGGASTGFSYLRDTLRKPLTVLGWLVGAVLLIACANLGILTLARAAGRRHEIGVRIALGSGRWPLVRQLLIESVIVSSIGAALAIAICSEAGRFLVNMMWIGYGASDLNVAPDLRVFGFAVTIAIAVGILCGIAPALRASRIDPATALQQTARTSHGRGARLRAVLVTAQIALSVLLVFGAQLFIRTLDNLHNANTGYRRNGLLLMQLFPQPGREKIPNRAVYYKELTDKLADIPGVTGVSYSYNGPVTKMEFREAVSTPDSASAPVESIEGIIGPDFIKLMGMHILAGREFTWADDEHSPKVALVSESLARQLFPGRNPIGATVSMANRPELTGARIVGVIGNASLWRVDSHNPPALYAAMLQNTDYNEGLLDIRTAGDPLALAKPAQAVLLSMGHQYALRTQSLRERLDMFLADERMLALLSGFFGVLALVLAGIGLYGLLSEAVTSRTSEIGIRIAVGAQRGQVLSLFLFDAARLVGIGLVAGTAIALLASRLISSMLFGISPSSLGSIALPCAVLALAALIATYVPARRASRLDPVKALRAE